MAVHLRDGYYGTCTSPGSGTGAYTGVAAVAGFRSFATLTDGDQVTVAVRSATGWGEDILATKSGGSTPTLTRTQILSNINSNTSPIDWPAGTPLVIYSTVSGVEIASLLKQNTWNDHQLFNGKRVTLSVDGNTYWYSPAADQATLVMAGAPLLQAYKGGSNENLLQLVWNDGSATAGPGLVLQRISSSPATADPLAFISFVGRNSAGTDKTYGWVFGAIDDVTASSENGAVLVDLLNNGTRQNALKISPTNTLLHPAANSGNIGLLVNKTVQGIGNIGVELLTNGVISTSVGSVTNLQMNRTSATGNYISFLQSGAEVGTIDLAGGLVALHGGGITHSAEFAQPGTADPPYGTVMCSIDELVDDGLDLHPKVVVSSRASDPAVYGVWQQRKDDGNGVGAVLGVGSGRVRCVGPVRHGDLLESSPIPGVARSQLAPGLQAWTLAKARGSINDDAERLLPCTMLAG